MEQEQREKRVEHYRVGEPYSDRLSCWVEGKTVAIVGPSPSLEGKGLCGEIDNHDVVVRLNRALLEKWNPLDLGTGTDILCHCLCEAPNCGGRVPHQQLAQKGIKLMAPYPAEIAPFAADAHRNWLKCAEWRVPLHTMGLNHYRQVEGAVATRPNTGILAILDILAHRPKLLSVYGFTFFRDSWRKGYKSDPMVRDLANEFNGNHLQEPQRQLIKKVWRDNPTVLFPDEAMREALSG